MEEMLKTKEDEIKRLEAHAQMREDGLTCSAEMLEADIHSFIGFFNDIKEKASQANKDLEEQKRKRMQKMNELREISDQHAILQSQINKNIESLTQFYNYKEFLDILAPKEEIQEYKRYRDQRKKIRDQEKAAQALQDQ